MRKIMPTVKKFNSYLYIIYITIFIALINFIAQL